MKTIEQVKNFIEEKKAHYRKMQQIVPKLTDAKLNLMYVGKTNLVSEILDYIDSETE